MRRLDLIFTALLVPMDIAALLSAAISAYALRSAKFFTDVRPLFNTISVSDFFLSTTVFIVASLFLFLIAGLYSTRPRRAWFEAGRIVLALTSGLMIVIASVFLRREFTASRFLVLALWGLAILYVIFLRTCLRHLRYALLRAGIGYQHVVIIGKNKVAQDLARVYETERALGFCVVATLEHWNTTSAKTLTNLLKQHRLRVIVLADPDMNKKDVLDLIAFTEQHHLEFKYLADSFAARFTRVEVSTAGGIPIISVKPTPLDGWGRIVKRLFDIVFAFSIIVLTSPIMLLTALAIKLESPGKIFFRLDDDQTLPRRIGEYGEPFPYLKFRSMYRQTHMQRYRELSHLDTRHGPLVKIKDDPRITRVGKFIRTWSIDELPEFFLVLRGHMSVVGPRPHLPEEVSFYRPHHRRVLAIKPGITGMAQVSGRSDLDFEDEVRLDTWYIENWSLALDIWILLKTPLAIIKHRTAE